LFILDYATIHSLIKQLDFTRLDGSTTLANQAAYAKLYTSIQSINDSIAPIEIPDDQKEIIHNFNAIHQRISQELINTQKLLPGTQGFELKFLKLISEVFDKLQNGDDNSGKTGSDLDIFQQKNLLGNIDANLNKVFVDKQDRQDFLRKLISNYLYNRPMGVKFQWNMGKMTCTIHGTSGLGLMQGMYVRGVLSELDGIYRISKVEHNIGFKFETHLEAVLIFSTLQNQQQKILRQISEERK
jgi:hypothetical protein